MKCEILKIKGDWRDVADAARETIGMEAGTTEPVSTWKRRMLLAEHSPIRAISVVARWIDLTYWVSVHFVRHKVGIEHWVESQRSDRTGILRDDLPQGSLVNHRFEANMQAIIAISRKRLCNKASPETRIAWRAFLYAMRDQLPELYDVCVPDCIYRGKCFEYKPCVFDDTKVFYNELNRYRE